MKKKIFFASIIILITISTIIIYKNLNSKYKSVNSKNVKDNYISIMYTDTESYTANYGIYNLNSNEFKKVYSRENHGYSDFAIDHKSNTLYYSAVINKKSNLYKIDLSNKKSTPEKLLDDNINADMFKLNNNQLFFRTRMDGHRNFTIGVYNLTNKQINIWDKDETDIDLFTFCFNKFNNKIYTVEYSFKEFSSTKHPDIPNNSIIQYNENGNKEKQLYTTQKWINSVSVNSDGTKALIAASVDETLDKIYLIDLNTSKEEILLKPKDSFEKITYYNYRDPQFSSDNKGFYFIASTQDSKILEYRELSDPIMSKGIYYYDFSTKKITNVIDITDKVTNRFKIQ